jgi:hypothetical protein
MRSVLIMALAAIVSTESRAVADSFAEPVPQERAGKCYDKLMAMGFDHPDLFLGCGNSHLLADDLPNAILAYRRGISHYPLNAALWNNLELARDQVAYPGSAARHRPSGEDWPPFLPGPTPNDVLFSALTLHGLAWVAVTAWLMTRRRWVAVTAAALFAAALLAGGLWAYLQYRIAEDQRQPLVVVAVNGMTLRRGNGTLYPRHPDLPQVNRGMEGRLLSERGEWVQVQFPGGEIGWLPSAAVLVDRRDPSL